MNEIKIAEFLKKTAERALMSFCNEHRLIWGNSSDRLEFKFEGNCATLVLETDVPEGEPPHSHLLAQVRFIAELEQWSLHYRDSEGRWVFYPNAGCSLNLGKLLEHLRQDPFHLFWPETSPF